MYILGIIQVCVVFLIRVSQVCSNEMSPLILYSKILRYVVVIIVQFTWNHHCLQMWCLCLYGISKVFPTVH